MTSLVFLLSKDILNVIVYKNFIAPNFDNLLFVTSELSIQVHSRQL